MSRLSEQLAELANPAPNFRDPEDSLDTETRAKLVSKDELDDDFKDNILPSSLRKKNVSLLGDEDKTYAGKAVSRKELIIEDEIPVEESAENNSSDDDGSDSFDENKEINEFRSFFSEVKTAQSDESDSVSSENKEDEQSDSNIEEDTVEDFDKTEIVYSEDGEEAESSDENVIQQFSEVDFNDEIEKGKAVKAQLTMWDSLLECRIKMQKLLQLANQLPQQDTWQEFEANSNESFVSALDHCQKNVMQLMNTLITMQTNLLKCNPETKSITLEDDPSVKFCTPQNSEDSQASNKKSRKRSLSLEDYENVISKRHKNFINFRNETIQKWSDKTRIASGKFSQKSFSGFDQSAVKQINQILVDKTRLIRRTQLKRGTYRVLGKAEEENVVAVEQEDNDDMYPKSDMQSYDPEIFDDGDFYHQLLRELIERKTSDVNNPSALGRQWLEIQKIRGKIKRKVDTKASKGRKIRFNVIPKLVNFMAPIYDNNMTDAAKNELFGSLFGKYSTSVNPVE